MSKNVASRSFGFGDRDRSSTKKKWSRQDGQEGKSVVFTTTLTLIAWSRFNPHPAVTLLQPLDETLYDDFLCSVALQKHQIQWIRIQTTPLEHCDWITENSNDGADFSKHEVSVVTEMKTGQVIQYLESDAVRWQEAG